MSILPLKAEHINVVLVEKNAVHSTRILHNLMARVNVGVINSSIINTADLLVKPNLPAVRL